MWVRERERESVCVRVCVTVCLFPCWVGQCVEERVGER